MPAKHTISRPSRSRPLLVILLVLLTLAAFPAGSRETYTPPVIDKKEWTVAFGRFGTAGADTNLFTASSLIPRLIRRNLQEAPEHRLSDADALHLASSAVEKKLSTAYQTLESSIKVLDQAFFNPKTTVESLAKKRRAVEKARAEVEHWKSFEPSSLAVPETLPLAIVSPEGGGLWEQQSAHPASFHRFKTWDFYISGEISGVGEYFGISVAVHSQTGPPVVWETVGREDEFESIASRAADALRETILGRPWGGLSITAAPSEALLFLDGEFAGIGTLQNKFLAPGPHTLEISASGHSAQSLDVILTAGETQTLAPQLAEAETRSVLVDSVPGGASVRLGSILLGVTPLSIPMPDSVMSLKLEMEGFKSRTLPLLPETERLTVPLEASIADPAEIWKESWRKLYNSITWFSLSLAPTLALMGISSNYASKNILSTLPADQSSSYYAYYTTYGFMWGSLAVNAALLSVTLYRLHLYLKAAEELSD